LAKTTIKVDPDLIRWARESAGLSVPEVAKRVGVQRDKIEEWESTLGLPTPRQLERLADAVKRPVAAFFLPGRPVEPPAPIDFRAASGSRPELSSRLRLLIRRTRRLMRIYEELSGEPAAVRVPEPSRIPLKVTRTEPASVAAGRIRNALDVSWREQASWGGPKAALSEWRKRVERNRALVFQFNMPQETVSGFSLANGVPAIVLNKSESESRRTFTLFHEWAHVLLGEPGLCSVDEGQISQASDTVESYCNAFAAELLVPLEALREADYVTDAAARRISLDDAIAEGVAQFSVSRWVVLLRLLAARAVDREQVRTLADRWTAETPPARAQGGRNMPHKRALQNLGTPFVSRVLAARESGTITDADVTDYLGLKLKWVEILERETPSN
jgi:Zn-dependent peptidase ImmA (M78 family)/transcriptional regulator with XRE-family HTH domain